jgi:hypothetical protein
MRSKRFAELVSPQCVKGLLLGLLGANPLSPLVSLLFAMHCWCRIGPSWPGTIHDIPWKHPGTSGEHSEPRSLGCVTVSFQAHSATLLKLGRKNQCNNFHNPSEQRESNVTSIPPDLRCRQGEGVSWWRSLRTTLGQIKHAYIYVCICMYLI